MSKKSPVIDQCCEVFFFMSCDFVLISLGLMAENIESYVCASTASLLILLDKNLSTADLAYDLAAPFFSCIILASSFLFYSKLIPSIALMPATISKLSFLLSVAACFAMALFYIYRVPSFSTPSSFSSSFSI